MAALGCTDRVPGARKALGFRSRAPSPHTAAWGLLSQVPETGRTGAWETAVFPLERAPWGSRVRILPLHPAVSASALMARWGGRQGHRACSRDTKRTPGTPSELPGHRACPPGRGKRAAPAGSPRYCKSSAHTRSRWKTQRTGAGRRGLIAHTLAGQHAGVDSLRALRPQ